MGKNLYCILGMSGSGKTSICNELESLGHKQIASYTTRKPRFLNEQGHTFVSDTEFDKLEDIVAFADYRGTKYGVTAEQVDDLNYDLYVVDFTGLKGLQSNYKGERKIVSIFIQADIPVIYERLSERYKDKSSAERTETVLKRLSDDIIEFRQAKKSCDYIVPNGNAPLNVAVKKVEEIILKEELNG